MIVEEYSLSASDLSSSLLLPPPTSTEEVESMSSAFASLSVRGKRNADDEGKEYKSKNLETERRRRQKLSDRLLELRALVPIITNMNKATIIVDAITYIERLQGLVRELSNQLLDLEAASADESKAPLVEATDVVEDMNEEGIEPEVKVTQIEGNKLWIKILHGKKRGGFVKLMEAISSLGFEFTDTSLTTYRGAILFTACLEGNHDGVLEADHVSKLLLEIVRGI